MRKPLIVGNWKMFKDIDEAKRLAFEIRTKVADIDNIDLLLAPAAIDIPGVCEILCGTNVAVCAQNCHWKCEGAFTGEISVGMIKSAGCTHVIIGHSERRKYFGETDKTVNLKVEAAIKGGLVPIVCVGETLEQRETDKTMEVVKSQVAGGLKDLDEDFVSGMIIAYEPVWAIGTSKSATPEQAQDVHAMIRGLVTELYSEEFASYFRLLYGGSVKPGNIRDLMKQKDIDGALIGGASLDAESFAAIAEITSQLYVEK